MASCCLFNIIMFYLYIFTSLFNSKENPHIKEYMSFLSLSYLHIWKVYIMWPESLDLFWNIKGFSSQSSREEILLMLVECSELWTNWSFYWMFPVLLFCITFSYPVQESSHFLPVTHFLKVYLILVISCSLWILAWVFLGLSLMMDRLINFSVHQWLFLAHRDYWKPSSSSPATRMYPFIYQGPYAAVSPRAHSTVCLEGLICTDFQWPWMLIFLFFKKDLKYILAELFYPLTTPACLSVDP